MHPDWARSIRDQCKVARVPFFFKQCGEWIDADEWLNDLRDSPNFKFTIGGAAPSCPLNFADAAALAEMSGAKFEHQSDGTTTFRVGKKRAGRLLDGVEHNAFPEARP